MAAMGGKLFSLCGLKRNSSKIVHEILIRRKTWPQWGGGELFSLCGLREILQNSFPLKLRVRFWNNFTGLLLGCAFSKSVRKTLIHQKTWRLWGAGEDFLHYMDMKKFLKNLLLWNRWSEFVIISQDCSLGDPFKIIVREISILQKHGRHVGGGIQTWRNS